MWGSVRGSGGVQQQMKIWGAEKGRGRTRLFEMMGGTSAAARRTLGASGSQGSAELGEGGRTGDKTWECGKEWEVRGRRRWTNAERHLSNEEGAMDGRRA